MNVIRVAQITFLAGLLVTACAPKKEYDIIIRQGTVYDGLGKAPVVTDVAINADTIALIGDLNAARGKKEIDAKGLAVSPGFINMLSWAGESLLKDGRSMSDIKQGVTLEVFGEGYSPGPKGDSTAEAPWKTLGQYARFLQKKGCSPNFASFVGATSVRQIVLGSKNVAPDPSELERMKQLVREAMKDGAMGVGSSLIYAPADYASTDELIALCREASAAGGLYISHMRNESDRIYKALDELFRIAKEANIRSEIYHLKINQKWNWNKIDTVLSKIDSAQKAGLIITADMYSYNASGTGLVSRLPTWVQEGGAADMRKRIRDPKTRKKILHDLAAGIPNRNSDPADVKLTGFKSDSLNKLYKGKRLSEIAALHHKSADETLLDLLVADRSSLPSIFFLISDENVKRMLRLPFVSICSDAGSIAAEEPWINEGTHPRTYGSFARFLGKYVREEKITSLEDGIRRMTSLPATNLRIRKRGSLVPGYFADIAIFDPGIIGDKATFDEPHQYAVGMNYVLVNGTVVLEKGEHTKATPGRFVPGPGYSK